MIRNAHYRKIPCYFDDETNEIIGRNWIYDLLVDLNIWLDINVFDVEEFPILVECTNEEVEEYNKLQKHD